MTTTTATAFTFACPLPPPEVHQNGRRDANGKALNVWTRNKAVQTYRQEVGLCAREAMHGPPWRHFERARLSLKFVVPDRRRRDVLNYAGAAKPLIDALVDVNLLRDDDWTHLSVGSLSMRVMEPGEKPEVVVRLEAVEGDS